MTQQEKQYESIKNLLNDRILAPSVVPVIAEFAKNKNSDMLLKVFEACSYKGFCFTQPATYLAQQGNMEAAEYIRKLYRENKK